MVWKRYMGFLFLGVLAVVAAGCATSANPEPKATDCPPQADRCVEGPATGPGPRGTGGQPTMPDLEREAEPSPTATATPTLATPPFDDLKWLVSDADLAIVGQVVEVSNNQEALYNEGHSRVEYYDATVQVERVIFGPTFDRIAVRVPYYFGPVDRDALMPTKAPGLAEGEHVLLFLSHVNPYFDLVGSQFVTTGGGVLWGKFSVEGQEIHSLLRGGVPPRPLEEVVGWIGDARLSLARPGKLSGEILGLDSGDKVTLRLEHYSQDRDIGTGEVVYELDTANGTWEKNGLRLSQGWYALVPEAQGYLSIPRATTFQVPEEGVFWQDAKMSFELFRPEDAVERFGMPLCQYLEEEPTAEPSPATPAPLSPGATEGVCFGGHTGIGWHVERGITGQISGLPEGVSARVWIDRLPPVDGECYDRAGPDLPTCTYPKDLVPIGPPMPRRVPADTVAVLEVTNGRWGLVDPSLGGARYLVGLQTDSPGQPIGGYNVTVFTGKAPTIVDGVDFTFVPRNADAGPTATAAPFAAPTPTPSPTATPMPTTSQRQVTIAPGLVLETYSNSNWALLWTRDGEVHLRGDGTVNYCNFHTEEGRHLLEEILADQEAMARIRAYLEEWGLVGKPVELPMGLGMQAPAEVQLGTEAILKVSIYSNSDCPVEYLLGDPSFDFAVTRLDGTELWRWSQGKTAGEPTSLHLGEREERAFEAAWDLHDKEGRPLPEGAYWVQGYLNIGLKSGTTPAMHPTRKHLLFIGPRLPLTNWLEAWLEVPQEAKPGEPVALDLKVRNSSNEPVQLFHGSGPFDFAILGKDGREVWRWSQWKVFTSELRSTVLQPAETLTYSTTWDQHDQDCQPDPAVYGQPCSGNPVSPGRYSVHATFEAALSNDYAEYRETIQVGPKVLEVLP